jgi:hypothetical protein
VDYHPVGCVIPDLLKSSITKKLTMLNGTVSLYNPKHRKGVADFSERHGQDGHLGHATIQKQSSQSFLLQPQKKNQSGIGLIKLTRYAISI